MSCCKQGDWMCGACQHVNFKKRDMCQRCTCPRAADVNLMMMMSASYHQQTAVAEAGVLAGDWYCSGCGAHNYASRSCCYRCSASKISPSDHNYYGGYAAATDAAIPGWKTGDWICNRYGCGMHNYASRLECLKCHTPRD